MDTILWVDACARAGSRTRELARHVIGCLEGRVEQVSLFDQPIPPLDWAGVQEREAALRAGDPEAPILRYARQFARADTIVVAAPYWDLLFPAALRAYWEAVTVSGATFRYNDAGIPESLCRAKRLFYVTTAGGPIGENDFGFAYVRALAQTFFAIPQVLCFTAEGLDIVGADPGAILARAKQEAQERLRKELAR